MKKVQTNAQQVIPPPPPIASSTEKPFIPPIQGDPAAQRFGLVFFTVLAFATIGAAVGIGVGNISHYRYFGPTNQTFVPNNTAIFDIINHSTRPHVSLILILSSTICVMKIFCEKNFVS